MYFLQNFINLKKWQFHFCEVMDYGEISLIYLEKNISANIGTQRRMVVT